jgi:hypothetical protein
MRAQSALCPSAHIAEGEPDHRSAGSLGRWTQGDALVSVEVLDRFNGLRFAIPEIESEIDSILVEIRNHAKSERGNLLGNCARRDNVRARL